MFLKQSTAVNVLVLMIDSADHIAGKTGLTLTITAYKAGAAGATITPTVTERTNGLYQLAFTTAHTDTLGQLVLHITGTGADPTTIAFQVVTELPGVDTSGVTTLLSRIASAITITSGRVNADVTHNAGTAITSSAGRQEVNVSHAAGTAWNSGAITANSIASGALTAAKFAAGAFDAVWSVATRLLTAGTNIVLAKGTGVTGFNDPTADANADALLGRNVAGGSSSGRLVKEAFYALRNRSVNSGGTLTVYQTDDSTTSWTATTTTGGSPITSIDPS